MFETIARGEFNISGLKNKHLQRHLADRITAQISRILKRLRSHRLVKNANGTHRCYLTKLRRHLIAVGLSLKQLFLIPELAKAMAD